MRDTVAQLAEILYAYQRQPETDETAQRLGRILADVLRRRVRPILARRLRPDDVEDVVTEVTIAFWQNRHTIRAAEVGRFIHAVAHRKLVDQIRGYYREAQLSAGNPRTEAGELLDILPAACGNPETGEDDAVWSLLASCSLADTDHLTAYLVYIGLPKGEIARVLGVSPNTVTNALKRCRARLYAEGHKPAGGGS